MSKSRKLRYKSLGHKMLCELPETGVELAALCRRSFQAVSKWRRGLCSPDPEARALLTDKGIPLSAWHSAANVKVGASATNNKITDFKLKPGSALADVAELIGTIQAARRRPDISPNDITKLATAEVKLQTLLARLERDATWTETRIVESAQWQAFRDRLIDAMFDALKPYPGADRDVMAAIEKCQAAAAHNPEVVQ